MQGHGNQIAFVDIPRPGDDLEGFLPAHVQLANPHVVAVRVALHGQDAAHHHTVNFRAQIGGALHLGAGQGHGLGELLVRGVYFDKLIEPFAA